MPRDFAVVLDPGGAPDQCDVVVVAAWWESTAYWYKADLRVIAERSAVLLPPGDRAR